ncbi:gamma-glutamylaminecyclotransferase-like isoform X2 [Physella acuta]|uniref:gamma-glutamylaminecyclotransferase-like isoform X2 n=1 Tax=Physella acuta TaxID=109671 RepID=UPI0027DB042A|nr:gamma-glutamylaminecyclotransferase-like isoform X2 [Physella acuta]
MATTHLVFSYGTLKSGEPNFEVMNNPSKGRSTFVGVGETVKRYPLVVASQYAVPFLLLVEGKGENVQGEIYEVDEPKLASLDELECHPDFYHRKKTEILMYEDSQGNSIEPPEIKECWVYFLPRYKPEMIDLPYLKKYNSISSDHPPYVASNEETDLCLIMELLHSPREDGTDKIKRTEKP